MSTHNIGFYEEISKIITELSSDIIKYAPYFFCCDVTLFLLMASGGLSLMRHNFNILQIVSLNAIWLHFLCQNSVFTYINTIYYSSKHLEKGLFLA